MRNIELVCIMDFMKEALFEKLHSNFTIVKNLPLFQRREAWVSETYTAATVISRKLSDTVDV